MKVVCYVFLVLLFILCQCNTIVNGTTPTIYFLSNVTESNKFPFMCSLKLDSKYCDVYKESHESIYNVAQIIEINSDVASIYYYGDFQYLGDIKGWYCGHHLLLERPKDKFVGQEKPNVGEQFLYGVYGEYKEIGMVKYIESYNNTNSTGSNRTISLGLHYQEYDHVEDLYYHRYISTNISIDPNTIQQFKFCGNNDTYVSSFLEKDTKQWYLSLFNVASKSVQSIKYNGSIVFENSGVVTLNNNIYVVGNSGANTTKVVKIDLVSLTEIEIVSVGVEMHSIARSSNNSYISFYSKSDNSVTILNVLDLSIKTYHLKYTFPFEKETLVDVYLFNIEGKNVHIPKVDQEVLDLEGSSLHLSPSIIIPFILFVLLYRFLNPINNN
ncbi:hypothetical protein CYY_003134 [Polysphondylium violaceum]|uniref:Uncharacterized protein n=1 Tax=Polysphondylium violaceum TaxID=133409 RepID=A0A8J4PX24_9MYCE|nr:hypothetical protein CYY_003134 [Polysphondylium violaceum]